MSAISAPNEIPGSEFDFARCSLCDPISMRRVGEVSHFAT